MKHRHKYAGIAIHCYWRRDKRGNIPYDKCTTCNDRTDAQQDVYDIHPPGQLLALCGMALVVNCSIDISNCPLLKHAASPGCDARARPYRASCARGNVRRMSD